MAQEVRGKWHQVIDNIYMKYVIRRRSFPGGKLTGARFAVEKVRKAFYALNGLGLSLAGSLITNTSQGANEIDSRTGNA